MSWPVMGCGLRCPVARAQTKTQSLCPSHHPNCCDCFCVTRYLYLWMYEYSDQYGGVVAAIRRWNLAFHCHSLFLRWFLVVLWHFLANKPLSYITIQVYLSALRFTQIASGLPDPSLSSFPHLDYVFRGIQRLLPQCK